MASSSIIKSYKYLDLKEEHIIVLDVGIDEIFPTLRNLTEIKSKISQNPNLVSFRLLFVPVLSNNRTYLLFT